MARVHLRMTDLIVDLLDRYEPEPLAEDEAGLVNEESAGVTPFGVWTLLADAPALEAEEVAQIVDRLQLRDLPDFEVEGDLLAFPVEGLSNEDVIGLLEAVDATSDLLEVSGEVDVHERSITWMGDGADPEPMPMPVPRPGDEVPLLVEEFAIHLKRHAAAPPTLEGRVATYRAGVELYGRPYVLLRDELEDVDALRARLAEAGLPEPEESRAHRLEWAEGELEPEDVYALVATLRDVNPVIGFASGITWRNEALQVEEPEAA